MKGCLLLGHHGENRKTGRVEEEVTPKLPDSSRDLTNRRTSEQTGLTAGPGSVRERLWNHKAEVGEGGWEEEEGGGEGVSVPPHNWHCCLRGEMEALTLDLHLPTTLYIFCSWIWKKKRESEETANFSQWTHDKKKKKGRKRERISECMTWRQA